MSIFTLLGIARSPLTVSDSTCDYHEASTGLYPNTDYFMCARRVSASGISSGARSSTRLYSHLNRGCKVALITSINAMSSILLTDFNIMQLVFMSGWHSRVLFEPCFDLFTASASYVQSTCARTTPFVSQRHQTLRIGRNEYISLCSTIDQYFGIRNDPYGDTCSGACKKKLSHNRWHVLTPNSSSILTKMCNILSGGPFAW